MSLSSHETEYDSQGLPLNDHYLDQPSFPSHDPRGTIPSLFELEARLQEAMDTGLVESTNTQGLQPPENEPSNTTRKRKWYHLGIPKALSLLSKKQRSADNEAGATVSSRLRRVSTKLMASLKRKGSLKEGSNQPPQPSQPAQPSQSNGEEYSLTAILPTQRYQSVGESVNSWREAVKNSNTLKTRESVDMQFSSLSSAFLHPFSIQPPTANPAENFRNMQSQTPSAINTQRVRTTQNAQQTTSSGEVRPKTDDHYERYNQYLAVYKKKLDKPKVVSRNMISDDDSKSQDTDETSKSKNAGKAEDISERMTHGEDSQSHDPHQTPVWIDAKNPENISGYIMRDKDCKDQDPNHTQEPNYAKDPVSGKSSEQHAGSSAIVPEEVRLSGSGSSPTSNDLWSDTKQAAIEAASKWERSLSHGMLENEIDRESYHRQNASIRDENKPVYWAGAASQPIAAGNRPFITNQIDSRNDAIMAHHPRCLNQPPSNYQSVMTGPSVQSSGEGTEPVKDYSNAQTSLRLSRGAQRNKPEREQESRGEPGRVIHQNTQESTEKDEVPDKEDPFNSS